MSVVTDLLSKPGVQRVFWSMLRTFTPVLKIGNNVFVSRYADVIEVLKRDEDFTIAEINGKRMEEMQLPFFLGMDKSEQHDKELALMQQVVKKEDLGTIQNFVRKKSTELIAKAKADGQIEIVNEYARIVPLYLIQEYFGIQVKNEEQMKHWMRILFHHLFLNLQNDADIKNKAQIAAGELKLYMEQVISERKSMLQKGDVPNGTILDRLLERQKSESWITDDVIRRNICGLIIGSVDTTSKCVCLAMEVLLKKPEYLKQARQAALGNDIQTLGKYMLEALRFNPHNPIVLRYCNSDASIGSKHRKIRSGSTLYVGINSAMFDRKVFDSPKKINTDRKVDYVHWSYGLHACFGRYINMVQIPELMAGLLRLDNLRRAKGKEKKIEYDGPFPDKYLLKFDQ